MAEEAYTAEPRIRRDIFAWIDVEHRKLGAFSGEAGDEFLRKEIQRYNELYPKIMRNAKPIDYLEWQFEKTLAGAQERQQHRDQAAQTTPMEFFDAAYEFNPLTTSTPVKDTKLVKLQCSESVRPIALGKVYGDTMLWLIPGPGALPLSNINAQNFTSWNPAYTDSGAIKYPDAHPSEDYEQGGSFFEMALDPIGDRMLRRFWPLGWIAYKRGEDEWERNGHVLVMDMDKGPLRGDRTPWLVLAAEWPDTNSEGDPDSFKIKAKQPARRDDPEVHGIYRGDHSRTPVARIVHLSSLDYETPILKQFGPDFEFGLDRRGGDRPVRTSRKFKDYHPDLAHIMGWYWDDIAKKEVGFAENGKEFMRRSPSTGEYSFPNPNAVPLNGQIASWGETTRRVTAGYIELESRMADVDFGDIVPREPQTSTTAGF